MNEEVFEVSGRPYDQGLSMKYKVLSNRTVFQKLILLVISRMRFVT